MKCFIGLDVSLRSTAVCIVNEKGAMVREASLATDAKVIAAWLRGDHLRFQALGLEAGAIGRKLCDDLRRLKLPAICIEAKHAHKVLGARLNKTDRNDAHGIADLMRMGVYKSVHLKSVEGRKAQALITARRLVQSKLRDIDRAVGGILRSFGLPGGNPVQKSYALQVRAALRRESWLSHVIEPLLAADAALRTQFERLDGQVRAMAREDPVCLRLMTAPGVGPLVALTYRSVIDDPARFKRSRSIGAHLGLTPKTRQSGEEETRGGISKWGDKPLRSALTNAAAVIMNPHTRPTALKAWGEKIAARRGRIKAIIALARHLAVILHHMWIDGADYREAPATVH